MDDPAGSGRREDPSRFQRTGGVAEPEEERNAFALRPGVRPRDLGGSGPASLEGLDEPAAYDAADRLALPVGEVVPDFRPEETAGDSVRVQNLFEGGGLSGEKSAGGAPSGLRRLLDRRRGELAGNAYGRGEERDREGEDARRPVAQAEIGSSRSTRGESDSAPRSVQRMSSSIRTPKRPGR